MDKKKLLFISNPRSGSKKKQNFSQYIENHIDKKKFIPFFEPTQYAGHAQSIVKNAIQNKVDVIVAIGGDGTVHEIAQNLINTAIPLGIIPLGSGNGIARSLDIPIQVISAIENINQFNIETIDVMQCNDRYFLGIAGIGFDALIAHEFAQSQRRGFLSYCKLVLKSYWSYQLQQIQLLSKENMMIKEKIFLIAIANTQQYGNNVWISPTSNYKDGLFEIIKIKKIPISQLPAFIFALFNKKLKNNNYIDIIQRKEIEMQNGSQSLHLDGEPLNMDKNLKFKIVAKALQVIKS